MTPRDSVDRFAGDVSRLHDPLGHGIKLFNEEHFFEAHDILEEVWMKDRTPGRKFYQGLIHLSGGFHHFRNGNYRGAVNLLTSGRGYLQPFRPHHGRVDLDALLSEVEVCLEQITRLRDGRSSHENVVFPKIPYPKPGT